MLCTYVADKNGSIKAQVPNPAVDANLLCEILSWNREGASIDDVVERLRVRTVPSGYKAHSWTIGNIKWTATLTIML